MKKVCVDTHLIMWGIRNKKYHDKGVDVVDSAKRVINYLTKQQIEVIVPSCVLAELLIPVNESEREYFIREIYQGGCTVCDFQSEAISLYPDLWKQFYKSLHVSGTPGLRQKLKIDFLILATAITHKCDLLITDDNQLLKMKGAGVEILKIEEVKTYFYDQQHLEI